jgi:tRNA(adenine34) deaminase
MELDQLLFDGYSDAFFMREALKEAQKALALGEVPVGAVVVIRNQIIARGHNLTERLKDVTAHAEMQAITAAANYLGGKYLKDCRIFITLEPCAMCAGALFWSQVSEVIYGASDEKRGYSSFGGRLHPKTKVVSGVLAEACGTILTDFFRERRNS